MSKKLTVMITGVGGRSFGHQILHAMLLTGDKYRLVCCDASAYSFGLYQVQDRYILPMASDSTYLEAVQDVIRREKVDILLPGTEIEIRTLAPHFDLLKKIGCHLIASSPDVIDLCQDKATLYEYLGKHNIGVPRSARVEKWKELVAACGYPIVAKPSNASGGSRNVEILATDLEVADYLSRFPSSHDEIVFQEYVGDAQSEYTVGVIRGGDGKIIDSIVLHRNLVGLSLGVARTINGKTYALSTGYSQGYIVKHPQIQTFCEELAVSLNITGPANIQLRLHQGQVKVFEVHPRFSGTTSIRADAGLNEPDLIIRSHVLHEETGRQPYQYDVAAIRAFQCLIVPKTDLDAVPKAPLKVS